MFKIDFNLIDYLENKQIPPIFKSEDYEEEIWRTYNKEVFRLLDDDENIYYYGRFLCNKSWGYRLFEPLDMFGLPYGGCTIIEYYSDETDGWRRI